MTASDAPGGAGPETDAATPRAASFLGAAGEMAGRMARHDWGATSIGFPDGWPQPLRTLVGLMLSSTQPMFMAWGDGRAWLYNDAFVPILGRKHPTALGRPALDVWEEAREFIGPLFDRVFAGTPVHMDDIELGLDRRGIVEEAHFAFSYTPVRDAADAVVGLFGTCIETTERVLAERRRAADHARQLRLFEQAPSFMAILDGPDHVFEFANAAYRRLVGERDVIGRPVRAALPEVAGQGFFELLDQVLANGRRYVASGLPVSLHTTPDNAFDVRYLDFIYEPIVDANGVATGIFVEGHDVTQAHRAQVELRAAERRQALLLELGDRIRGLADPGDISFAAAELLGNALGVSRAGYGTVDPVAETIVIERDWNAPGVKSLAGTLHFRDYGSYIEDLKRGETVVFADAEKDPRTRDTAAALKAISAQSVVNMPVTEHHGLVALLYLNHAEARPWSADELAFIREVAERTRSAVERRRAENDLVALAASLEHQVAERTAERDRVWKHSRDLLVVIGIDGIFRAVNPAWTTILGHEPGEVVGRSFHDFVWPEDAARTQSGLDAAAEARDLTDFENRYRHRDGSPRWISWQTAAEGDLVYAYGRDVTGQREQERALRQAEEALRQGQKLEAMGQLTGGVAHDFNNLLAVVTNNLFLHRKLSPSCEHSAEIAAISRAVGTGARLTRQLLAFSRRQALRPETIHLQQELPELQQVLRTTLGSQIDVRVDVAPDTPPVHLDRSELELAIINLAVNARDAMPEGGRLEVRACARTRLGAPTVAVIEVTDTGHGIPADILPRVLEPFFTTKPPGQGTGLGLSQVYGFARQSGGELDIASRPGATTITLSLPTTTVPAVAPLDDPAEPARRLEGRILVVEDHPGVGTTTQAMLQAAGADVRLVGSADHAREYLRSPEGDGVQLVLTDIVMPGSLSGVGLAGWIARERPGLPVLLATGYSRELAAAREAGYAVLQKPVAPEALVEAARRALGR